MKDDDAPPGEGGHCWSTSTAAIVPLGAVVREWLERQKMKVPDVLRAAAGGDGGEPPPLPLPPPPSSFASIDDILCLLLGLRKRE
jgi:hypothetical protein